jgi:hypothetical protein
VTLDDPFGTASVRERVLATWAASPARLREDANAEEDFSLGGYRDRVVVELAQNAADAAVSAGVPGRLRLSLTRSGQEWVLAAANTGAPLDAAGVAGLASLRASAKGSDDTVGRFGVGFAAVLALTDEPVLLSRNGSVRFSRADTTQLVTEIGGSALADEVRRRDGHLPALRLPFEADGEPPQGFSTAVLLPLRDDAAADLARRLLGDVDDALLLALPALDELEIEVDGVSRVLRDASDRWHTLRRSGRFTTAERTALFADRPTEESHRPWWSVLWALPKGPAPVVVPQVLHAPTPTDEPLAWPALLLATFPLEPSRRHVAPGLLTDRIVAEAGTAYAALLTERAATGDDVLPLVPTGLGAGALDTALRAAALGGLVDAPILRAVEDGGPLRPRDAVVIDGAPDPVLTALAPYVVGLVDAPVSGRTALRALGVQQMGLADVVEALPMAPDPQAWSERYDALAPLGEEPDGREALGVLPVPLADGRVVRGARGLVLPTEGLPAETLEDLAAAGVRLVHPDAVHPLLVRLGAVPSSPRQLLEEAAVRELVATSPDSDDPSEIAATVLGLARAAVAEGELAAGDLPWLGDLALPDSGDELSPAAALALPGSVAAALFDPDEIGLVADDLVQRWGAGTLVAVGVLDGLAVLVADDVDLTDPQDALLDLDGFAEWAATAPDGSIAGEVRAVRDLDAVRRDAWATAVPAIAGQPATRAALVAPVRVRDQRGRGQDIASYTSWWLRRELSLDVSRDPAGDPALAGLLDPAPAWVGDLDDEVRRALGVVRTFADLGSGAAGPVLSRLADPDLAMDLPALLKVWRWLAALPTTDIDPPPRVRALTPEGVRVLPSGDVVVVDSPMWLQRKDFDGLVVAPLDQGEALADLLDLDLATERADGSVTSTGQTQPVPAEVLGILPGAPADWSCHQVLQVDGVDVTWWVDTDGRPHAGDHGGLARALSWSAGRWPSRHLVAAVLTDPSSIDALMSDAAFD